jgi:hypothetical protein
MVRGLDPLPRRIADMDRARKIRLLRTTASAVILGLSGLFVALWMRNFRRADVVWAPLPGQGHVVVASHQGQLELALYVPSSAPAGTPQRTVPRKPNSTRWGGDSYSVAWNHIGEILLPRAKPFRYRRLWNSHEVNMIAPYWFLVPVIWMLAAAPWVRWSKRFSMRAMLIATTLVAIVLGIYVTSGW